MIKYFLLFISLAFSIVSVFAEKMGDTFFGWKSPVLTGVVIPTTTPEEDSEYVTSPIWVITGAQQTNEKGQGSRTSYYHTLRNPIRTIVFYEDSSLLRFVNRYQSLNDTTYAPTNLVSISGAHINEAGRKSYLRMEAKEALFALAEAFQKEFSEPLTVISGYRSANYQKRLWDLGRCTDSLCAPPWYSEHQLGLAVDLFDATTEREFENNKRYRRYVAWLREHAHLYGWTQSYQKWVAIDTYQIEPWHWRYVGIPMATRLKELGWSYAEYVGFQEAIQRR